MMEYPMAPQGVDPETFNRRWQMARTLAAHAGDSDTPGRRKEPTALELQIMEMLMGHGAQPGSRSAMTPPPPADGMETREQALFRMGAFYLRGEDK